MFKNSIFCAYEITNTTEPPAELLHCIICHRHKITTNFKSDSKPAVFYYDFCFIQL